MSNICEQLHNVLRKGKRFYFEGGFNGIPTKEKVSVQCIRVDFKDDFNGIPKKGIYVLFEKGEKGHNGDRIVRIGTHGTSKENNELVSRLKQHFIKENKNRSIFRKHIGRALLNKANDKYLEKWNLDTTSKANKEKISNQDKEYEKTIEKQVSEYIQNSFYFVVLEVKTSAERDYYESRLISTVSNCKECNASENWLGKDSPNTKEGEKIIESSLWNVKKLFGTSLTDEELKTIEERYLIK